MAKLMYCTSLCIALSVICPEATLMWSLAEQRMPMVVHVTSPHDVMPSDMQELWSRNSAFLDGAEVQYYNEDRMVATVQEVSVQLEKEVGIHGAWEAFQNLRPGAFRADLWRLMILWARGGVYLDCDLELQMPITTWLKHSDSTLFLVQDCQNIPGGDGLSWAYWNAMMASIPHHEILEHMIRTIVKRVQAHYYAEDQKWHRPLSITGPRALGMALESYMGPIKKVSQAAVLVSQKRPDGRDEPFVQLDGRTIVQHNQAKGLEKDYKLTSAHYDPLFWLHMVYCDEGGLPCTVASRQHLAKEHLRMLSALQTNTSTNTTMNNTAPVSTPVPTPEPTSELPSSSTPEPTPTPAPSAAPTPTPVTSATLIGSMTLTVSDPDAFASSVSAKRGVTRGFAQHLGVPADFIKVELSSVSHRRLKSAMVRRLEGQVQVDYEINIPNEHSAAYDVDDVAQKISDASGNSASSTALLNNLREAVAAEDSSIAAITNLTVTPATIHNPSEASKLEVEDSDSDGLSEISIIVGTAVVAVCIMLAMAICCICFRRKRSSA